MNLVGDGAFVEFEERERKEEQMPREREDRGRTTENSERERERYEIIDIESQIFRDPFRVSLFPPFQFDSVPLSFNSPFSLHIRSLTSSRGREGGRQAGRLRETGENQSI